MLPLRDAVATTEAFAEALIAGSTAAFATKEFAPIMPKPTRSVTAPSAGDSREFDEFAAVGAGVMRGFEYRDHIAGLLGADCERLPEQQVVRKVSMKSPSGMWSRSDV